MVQTIEQFARRNKQTRLNGCVHFLGTFSSVVLCLSVKQSVLNRTYGNETISEFYLYLLYAINANNPCERRKNTSRRAQNTKICFVTISSPFLHSPSHMQNRIRHSRSFSVCFFNQNIFFSGSLFNSSGYEYAYRNAITHELCVLCFCALLDFSDKNPYAS